MEMNLGQTEKQINVDWSGLIVKFGNRHEGWHRAIVKFAKRHVNWNVNIIV